MLSRARTGNDDGFTIVELMVVVLILGILVGIAVASYLAVTTSSRRVACLQNQRTLSTAVVQYTSIEGHLPSDLAAVQPLTRWTQGYGRCVSTPATFTYDPATGDLKCPTPDHQLTRP